MARVWGRTTDPQTGVKTWVEVSTDANGHNDAVHVTWMAQVIRLNLAESPFWGNWGIPQYQTIMSQVLPTFYVMQIQKQFAMLFASLSIVQQIGAVNPTYNVNAVTKYGAILPTIAVEIPT
jgi:hypothetical protein